jgi:hypothetical protein
MSKAKEDQHLLTSSVEMTQKDWLEYLHNFIERHLAREQSSGFSDWALAGVLVVIFYRILELLPTITEHIYLCIVLFFNILSAYSIFCCVSSFVSRQSIKFIDSSYFQRSALLGLIIYTIVVSMGIASSIWLSEYVRKQGYPNYGYFLIALLFSIYLIDNLYRYFVYKCVQNKTKGKCLSFYSTTRKNAHILDGFGGIVFLSGLLYSISGIPWVVILENISILERSLEFCTAIFIIQHLLGKIPIKDKINQLQMLEYRILLYNLSSNDIRNQFRDTHFEKNILDWIDDKIAAQDTIAHKVLSTEAELKDLFDKTADINIVDQKYNFFLSYSGELEKRLSEDDNEGDLLISQLNNEKDHNDIIAFQNRIYEKKSILKEMAQFYNKAIFDYREEIGQGQDLGITQVAATLTEDYII